MRTLDEDVYYMTADWTKNAVFTNVTAHQFEISPAKNSDSLELTCGFSSWLPRAWDSSNFTQAQRASSKHWNKFWTTGGAIDLSGSKDPRWFELERRIVLSEYLTAIQDAGANPPQETGLTYNTWQGKFHLEMHFWHEAHFALWDRLPLLERSLDYYNKILPREEGTDKNQCYNAARWPKMSKHSGTE